jgi:hypothetical protein
MVVHGSQATAIGIACIAAGLLAHFHWFWSGHPRFPAVGQIGKAITLCWLSACALYMFFSFWIG